MTTTSSLKKEKDISWLTLQKRPAVCSECEVLQESPPAPSGSQPASKQLKGSWRNKPFFSLIILLWCTAACHRQIYAYASVCAYVCVHEFTYMGIHVWISVSIHVCVVNINNRKSQTYTLGSICTSPNRGGIPWWRLLLTSLGSGCQPKL